MQWQTDVDIFLPWLIKPHPRPKVWRNAAGCPIQAGSFLPTLQSDRDCITCKEKIERVREIASDLFIWFFKFLSYSKSDLK